MPERTAPIGRPDLFQYGMFGSHSGLLLPWKIDCDALSNDDLAALAMIVRHKFAFSDVAGVPIGGLRFADALWPHRMVAYPTLIVDDVLTTGRSMEDFRRSLEISGPIIGVVIFARGAVPDWIWPIFTVNEWTQTRGTGVG